MQKTGTRSRVTIVCKSNYVVLTALELVYGKNFLNFRNSGVSEPIIKTRCRKLKRPEC